MSGGHGSGGYPGQGYGAPDFDDDPERARPRRQGRPRTGYQGPGYGSQDFDGRQYDSPQYDGRRYDGRAGYAGPGYDPRGYVEPDGQGSPGYRNPQAGPQAPRYGTGGRPVQRGVGPRRAAGGRDQRTDARYDQGGHDGWEQEQRDNSFLPGFGGRGGYDSGHGKERDGRHDYGDGYGAGYDDRRGPRGGDPGDRRAGGRGDRGDGGRGDRGDWNAGNAAPRKKATRWLPRILVLSVVLVIVIGGLVGGLDVYHRYEARYHPPDYVGQGAGDVTVQVMSGDSAFSLAPRLLQLGVIASTRAFTNAAEAVTTTSSTSTGLEAGYYQLHQHMQASLAYAALLNPKNLVQTTVTIPEGKRVSQILTILAARTKIPLAQFEAAAKQTSELGLPSYAGTTVKLPATVPYGQLEGYLFPATYAVVPHETALKVLQAMVTRYKVEAQQVNIVTAASSVGLTPSQLIIEASMVQAEAGLNADMPKMARVIINRKARGMPDGFSSVDFYGLGKYGINLTNSTEARAAGLYDNTQQLGLPPTPIDNPGDAAIQAVLHPAPGPWLYFVTTAVGKPTQFSATCFQGTCG